MAIPMTEGQWLFWSAIGMYIPLLILCAIAKGRSR